MTPDNPIAEFEISSGTQRGSRLTLYASRLAYQGRDAMESVPLAHLASVAVAFERDPRKLYWAIALLVLALILLAVSGPLQGGIAALAGGIKDHAGRESLESALLGTFSVLGNLARLLPLSFAAVERAYSVRGRNPFLIQFAEFVAAQLALRKG